MKVSLNDSINYKILLEQVINKAVVRLGFEEFSIQVQRPALAHYGDFSSSVALTNFSQLVKMSNKAIIHSPEELARVISDEISLELPFFVQSIEVVKPGFINFTISKSMKWQKIVSFLHSGFLPNKQIALVEFSSPNIAKPFTVGHLRSTVIGFAISNLLEAVGYQVLRDNHLGDWGTQFGKQIYALHHLGSGNLEENIRRISSSSQPVKELVELYVEFHQKAEFDSLLEDEGRAWFVKLESGDREARAIWQQCIDWSWQEFSELYKMLGVSFSQQFADGKGLGESYFQDKMKVVIDELTQKLGKDGSSIYAGAYRKSKGAWLVFFPDDIYPPLMIIKGDGSTLYATRDLATDYYRLHSLKEKPTLIVNEVGAEQSLYFKQLFKIEEMLGWIEPYQRVHVGHGLYRFKDRKMSTRRGDVIWLADVLTEAVSRVSMLDGQLGHRVKSKNANELKNSKKSKKTELVAIAAIKWNDLKRSARLDVNFDWDEILNMQGNSGPYLLYSVVRSLSIVSSVADKLHLNKSIYIDMLLDSKVDVTDNYTSIEIELLSKLFLYSDIVEQSAREYAPHHLCNYLYELAQMFNSWYAEQRVIDWHLDFDSGKSTLTPDSEARVKLVATLYRTLQQGLTLLGIQTVDKM